MSELLKKIETCIEFGKINESAPFPPNMRGQLGADELTKQALEVGIEPGVVLNNALIPGMDKVGRKFSENKIFVPQMLMSAKAMSSAMQHIKPFFQSGAVQRKGTFIIGTVAGDLHDIGKNLVAMMIEGAGWEVIDLGVDISSQKYIDAIKDYPNAVIGLSALLTTIMVNMEKITSEIKDYSSDTKVIIGGAPVNNEFCQKIGADFYSSDPQGAVAYLNAV
jgi:5-methyltetrahydrofolate--homocysteine methyltransferase